jgi:hypothetical protein
LLDVWRAFVSSFTISFSFVVPTLSLLGFIILTVAGRLKGLYSKLHLKGEKQVVTLHPIAGPPGH